MSFTESFDIGFANANGEISLRDSFLFLNLGGVGVNEEMKTHFRTFLIDHLTEYGVKYYSIFKWKENEKS